MVHVIAENIDRLVTVEMQPGGPGMYARGIVHKLYDAARREQGEPLSYLASKLIRDRAKTGSWVFITTGTGGPPALPHGEVDGLLGAASLARAIDLGLGAKTVVIGEERIYPPTAAAFAAAGVTMVEEAWAKKKLHSAVFEPIPIDDEGSRKRAEELVAKYEPAVVVAIERLGPNRKGLLHSGIGMNVDDRQAKPHHLFDLASERNIGTIGIGDAGNEIGFGMIIEDVLKLHPRGNNCMCPCKSGNATVTKTDVLIPASISNWGAYGISACLGADLENPNLIQDHEMQRRMLEDCVRAGAVDGFSVSQVLFDDGVPGPAHESMVQMLKTIVENGLSEALHWYLKEQQKDSI